MKRTLQTAAAVLLLLILIPLSSFAAGKPLPGPREAGALHVEGTQLLSRDGKPVRLCGVSTHGLQWYPRYVSGETFRELRECRRKSPQLLEGRKPLC